MRMTRRAFNQFALSGISAMAAASQPWAFAAHPKPNSLVNGVQLGLQPFCYHDLAMTPENRPELIRRLVVNGINAVELHST
jgi:hypothetical protein